MSTTETGSTSSSANATSTVEITDTTMAKKKVACSACGAEIPEGAPACMACGKKVSAAIDDPVTAGVEIEIEIDGEEDETDEVSCPECGAMNSTDAQVCNQCGCDMPAPEQASALPTWEGELAFEGLATSDGRLLLAGEVSHRDLPLTLMCQTVTADGHYGAEVCGKITNIWREDRPDMGEGVVAVMGSGDFSDSLMGPEAAKLLAEDTLRGVSVDISPEKRVILDRETGAEVAEEDLDFDRYVNGEYLLGIGGEIMGATLVPFPAFADARLRIISEPATITASAGDEEEIKIFRFATESKLKLIPVSITAAAAGIAPIAPPTSWFFQDEPEGKFPLTVMDDGRIMGHLATWDQCHHGFQNECVLAKPSRTDYAFFHVGQIRTREGEWIDVGRIVVGETARAGHASVQYSAAEASRHYDKTALVGAFVRAVDGKYGIWLSGVVRSDCPAEKVRDMIANPPSGDWRNENGWLELIAALSVPVPGFPVPRYEYSLVASADSMEVQTLIATGYYELDRPSLSRAEMRRKELLLREAEK